MRNLIWLAPCLALALSGADISGKWTGTIEVADTDSGATIRTPVVAEFQQKADSFSGKIGRRGEVESETVRNGRIEGKKVLFEVTSAETSGPMKFDLTLEDGRLEGVMKGAMETGPISGKVRLERQPPP